MRVGEFKMWPTAKTEDQVCCSTRVMNKKMGKPGVLLDTDYKSKIYVLLVKGRVN